MNEREDRNLFGQRGGIFSDHGGLLEKVTYWLSNGGRRVLQPGF